MNDGPTKESRARRTGPVARSGRSPEICVWLVCVVLFPCPKCAMQLFYALFPPRRPPLAELGSRVHHALTEPSCNQALDALGQRWPFDNVPNLWLSVDLSCDEPFPSTSLKPGCCATDTQNAASS